MISAVFAQQDIESAARELKKCSEEMVKGDMKDYRKKIKAAIFDVDGTLRIPCLYGMISVSGI